LNCREILVEIEPRRDTASRQPRPAPRKCPLEEEDDIIFYRCPRCKAKNIVAETRTENGFPELVVVTVLLQP
jgi:predicted Zn-ribbon and HTH transcriptional regulator